ncbi:PepSY domain-containing protein [Pseudomonas sp. MWU13-2105]|uniref:PepSY domain-containing protein n=1 Tax=Pseudomonas sp. MWU13-2105 TaxID=2935074 RepID=UPI00200E113D|nr:PepSY domain-containing protein [Pseudomonas sp. MWU13-2105]
MTLNLHLCAALVLAASGSLACANDLNQDEALRLRRQGVIMPLEQLLQQALNHYPGAKLLEAELVNRHDVYVYDVELLTRAGVVRDIELDASSGRLLKDKEDD